MFLLEVMYSIMCDVCVAHLTFKIIGNTSYFVDLRVVSVLISLICFQIANERKGIN